MSSNHIATVSLDVARRMRPRPPSVIMYKNQKQMKLNNDPKMGIMLEEEEESTYLPINEEHLTPFKQTRESGITHHLDTQENQQKEVIPELPSHYPVSQHMMEEEEEEDLIDPQHRSLPLDSNMSITSSISEGGGEEWNSRSSG